MLKSILAKVGPTRPIGSPAPVRRRIKISPDVSAIYVVPDIHGSFQELLNAERRIASDAAKNAGGRKMTILLGDYVDRGPKSADVIERCIDGGIGGLETVFLCGNHDWLMERFLDDPETHANWLNFGGDATLFSYGVDVARVMKRGGLDALREAALDAIPMSHIDFLTRLPTVAVQCGLVFVHAGIRPGIEIDKQTDDDLLWIREPFLSQGPGSPYVVVHGHSVAERVSFGINRIGVDTGAYATGKLSVLRLSEGRSVEV